MEEFEHLSLSRSSSIEESYGFELIDGVPITPPLVPAASPANPPPAPLASPETSAPARAVPHAWTTDELELAVGLFYRFGPRFRKIARHIAGRSEDAQSLAFAQTATPRPRRCAESSRGRRRTTRRQ